ncbi:hypothetical protein P5G86_09520 [Paenibacillus jamilae]|nr:hypothetical protein [Paenibacillus jamilae]MEB9280335.1 hypothetical protein [Bacillus cereus]
MTITFKGTVKTVTTIFLSTIKIGHSKGVVFSQYNIMKQVTAQSLEKPSEGKHTYRKPNSRPNEL